MTLAPPVPVAPAPPPGRVFILTKHIDAHIEAKNWERSKKPPRSWYASSIGKTCMRQLFYARLGVPAEKVIKSQYSRDGDTGSRLHEVYQGYMRELGLLHEDEITIQNDYFIGGRIDGIANPETDLEGFYEHEDAATAVVRGVDDKIARFVKKGEKGLLEIKTMKAAHFDLMPNHYKWPAYNAQAQVYLALRPDIVRGLIYCVCRDDSRTKEFLVERDEAYGQYLLAKSGYLEQCLRGAQEADPLDNISYLTFLPAAEPSGLCNFCPFQMRCEQDDLREAA